MDAARDFTDEWITIDTGYNAYVVDVGINMVVCDACHLRGYVEGIGGRKIKCPIFLSPPDDALTGVGKTLDDAAVDALDNWVYNGTNVLGINLPYPTPSNPLNCTHLIP